MTDFREEMGAVEEMFFSMERKRKRKTAKKKATAKKPHFIKEPFGLPFMLTKKDTFRKPKRR